MSVMDLYRSYPQFQLAEKICKRLQDRGFQALLAGGCVRDFLLHRSPNDFDVATNATPDQVESLFSKTVAVGKSFGVIVVVEAEIQVEVATFRKDGPYVDGRRPQSVEFAAAEEDAQRRDFTVNGLFYDLKTNSVLDYVGGTEDLQEKRLCAIGLAEKRFEEDHLRLLRAIRFSAQLDFEIEPKTLTAIEKQRDLIRTVSGERVQDELTKLLMSHWPEKGLELLCSTGLLASLLGNEELIWKPAHLVFARKEKTKEDHWFRFFLWLRFVQAEGASLFHFETLTDAWKFSRDLKQKCLKALQWTYEDRPFLRHPLGEILALSYQPEHLRGLMEYSELYLKDEERPHFEKFLSRRLQLGREKPAPWVVASDLSQKLQGEELGRAIRLCYWEQLEGNAAEKSDLLKMWGA
jgi:tRNA nucleotidyltransferase (CCA-adding enzyme)